MIQYTLRDRSSLPLMILSLIEKATEVTALKEREGYGREGRERLTHCEPALLRLLEHDL